MSFVDLDIRGLEQARRRIVAIPDVAERAAVLAVNDTARFGHAESSRQIRSRVAFKAGYLGSAEKGGSRLRIRQRAKDGDPTAIIAARQRPTSLATFAQSSLANWKRGKTVKVRVATGRGSKAIKGAFPIRLRRGGMSVSEDANNMGIALRLKEGERVRNKHEMVQLNGSLYLLYGPSVDQVFRMVSEKIAPELGDKLEANYTRQFDRLMKERK